MEKFLFENIEGVADKLLEEWDKLEENKDDDFFTISVVSHYNIMKDIINYLVKNTSFVLCNLELEEPTYRDYEDEYILTVDSNGEIWCQKANVDGRYIRVEDSITFVHSDVNSKFVVTNKDECLIEFDFGIEEETVCDCDKCCGCCDCNNEIAIESDNDMHRFTVNRSNENSYYSYSFYSTNEKLVEEMARLFK